MLYYIMDCIIIIAVQTLINMCLGFYIVEMATVPVA